ncbi:MAG TPA: LysR family transcriptional regulator [Cyanobacteria bacterium UBA11149]|nr:LysR family transcriptional regulator [Cyanobacteria bacterium UBA11367]HBE58897.1 LysR family transcriptional regulator [Cyanobacteria bacterium UBA11366]HBK65417.1 LysR family transcriptional regulator [Cyanobacteria bacterium UBA11166]HBR73541.1 LysR family transcriptional regulator [Cyanobacteria bacterium UBA11159]HBS71778.1 LysR family transcriptional regulator [Cyanobacteria bacterium UBA11153]HBW92229.1 LysR family transcriptional regulator [Cyanobacteria bacterium UBA11149]HCA9397
MRIEQLQAFLAVAETGNFGQAARKCGVTQSTISRQIQSLEADLGLPLFHRTSQAKLTLGGENLLPRARKICQEWHNATQELADLIAGKQPELCVAAIPSVFSHYLPPVLQKFCRDYPDVQLRITSLGSDRALKVLRDGLVDIAIVMNNRFLTASPEMVVDVLYNEPIELLMAANHPLTQYQQVPWSELGKYPQVMFKDGYGMQRLVQDWFSRQGINPQIVMELNALEAFRGVIRHGDLIALLPQSALLEARLDPTLAIRTIAGTSGQHIGNLSAGLSSSHHRVANISTSDVSLTRQVVLVTTQDRLQIPPIQYFCQLIRQLDKSTINPSSLVLSA